MPFQLQRSRGGWQTAAILFSIIVGVFLPKAASRMKFSRPQTHFAVYLRRMKQKAYAAGVDIDLGNQVKATQIRGL